MKLVEKSNGKAGARFYSLNLPTDMSQALEAGGMIHDLRFVAEFVDEGILFRVAGGTVLPDSTPAWAQNGETGEV